MYHVTCRAPVRRCDSAYGPGCGGAPYGMGYGMLHGISHMPDPIRIGAEIGLSVVTPVRRFECPHNGGGGTGSAARLFTDLSKRRQSI